MDANDIDITNHLMRTVAHGPQVERDIPSNILEGHRGPKSKTGCVTCKTRRIKCDETRPRCIQCHKKDLECVFLPPKVPGHLRRVSRTVGTPDVPAPDISHNHKVHAHSDDQASLAVVSRHLHTPRVSGQSTESDMTPSLKYNSDSPSSLFAQGLTRSLAHVYNDDNRMQPTNAMEYTSGMMHLDDEENYLTNIFFNTSTHLFSIYTGDCNPFMRLRRYLPESRALHLAIQAMAALSLAGHQYEDNTASMDRGLEIQRQAYRELSNALADPVKSLSDSTFAAIVHIGMTEPWHSLRSDQSGAMHLRTSKVLICQRHFSDASLPPKYLCNLLLYWDLLVSLHSDSSHEGYSTAMLLHGIHSENEPIDYIDPTVGLAQDLFSAIIEMEHFLREWRSYRINGQQASSKHLKTALLLKHQLSIWQPLLDSQKLLGCLEIFETTTLHHLLFTAEAYRQTALLLLQRSFPALIPAEAIPTRYLNETASSILRLLAAIPSTAPICTTHEWILFVTAPDVITTSERTFIEERMNGLLEKIGVIGIKEALHYIRSTWGMIDSGGPSSAWMDEMHKRNWLPLLG